MSCSYRRRMSCFYGGIISCFYRRRMSCFDRRRMSCCYRRTMSCCHRRTMSCCFRRTRSCCGTRTGSFFLKIFKNHVFVKIWDPELRSGGPDRSLLQEISIQMPLNVSQTSKFKKKQKY